MKKPEFIISFALVFVLFMSLSASAAQDNVSSKITRLHILANSDNDYDQALKLLVRDAIIESTDILNGEYSKENIDSSTLEKIEEISENVVYQNGFDYNVKASLTNMYFDTRVYDGFSLPAGNYDAVRIEIGEAQGKNWWCVMFPPLCAPLAGETIEQVALDAGLSQEDIGLDRKSVV